MSSPHTSAKFARRQLRGLGIVAKGGQIIKVNADSFKVKSQSSQIMYNVVWVAGKWTCNCPDFAKKLAPCKHIHAVTFMMQLPKIAEANNMTEISNGTPNSTGDR